MLTKFWIEAHPAASISTMTYNSGSPPTLTVTTSTAHGLATGNTVVIKDAVPTGYNGEYPVTVINTTSFTATLPSGTVNPGKYISAITWADISGSTDRATVTSPSHGLNSGDLVTIAGAVPTEYNGTRTITYISADSYRMGIESSYEPGNLTSAIAAPKALTPRATALANTTRPMSELDATAKALVQDTATIYDEQKSAWRAAHRSAPQRPVLWLRQHVLPSILQESQGRFYHCRATDDFAHHRARPVDRNHQPLDYLAAVIRPKPD